MSPRVMLTVGLLVAGLSNFFISFLPQFIGVLFFWTTNAYAQSMLWSSVLCVISTMYEGETAKRKTSLMVTSVALGNILAIILNTFLITKFGVEYAFLIPGIITSLLGVAVLFFTHNIKPISGAKKKKHLSMFKLLKNKELLLMGVPAVMHGVMKENISLWMTVFIVDKYLVELSTSSYYILLIPFIGFIGTLYPLVYRLCNNRENTVSMAGFTVCVVSSLILCVDGIGMLFSVILLLSVIYTATSMINTSILSIYPLQYIDTGNVASVSGVMDFATYLGGGVASMVYGLVVASFGYMPMFLSWAVISVVSVLMIVKINRDKKQNLLLVRSLMSE